MANRYVPYSATPNTDVDGAASVSATAIAAAIVTQADRNLVLAAWGVGLIPNNLSTGTATNGTGSASIASGDAILAYTDIESGGYQPGSWTGPRVTLTPAVTFGTGVRIVARLASIDGDNTTLLRIGMLSEVDNRFLGFRIRASDGTITAYTTGGAVVTASSPILRDGTGWLSFERHAGSVAWHKGVGTPTNPPPAGAWEWIYTQTAADAPDTTLGIGLAKSNNGLVGSVTIDNVYIQSI